MSLYSLCVNNSPTTTTNQQVQDSKLTFVKHYNAMRQKIKDDKSLLHSLLVVVQLVLLYYNRFAAGIHKIASKLGPSF